MQDEFSKNLNDLAESAKNFIFQPFIGKKNKKSISAKKEIKKPQIQSLLGKFTKGGISTAKKKIQEFQLKIFHKKPEELKEIKTPQIQSLLGKLAEKGAAQTKKKIKEFQFKLFLKKSNDKKEEKSSILQKKISPAFPKLNKFAERTKKLQIQPLLGKLAEKGASQFRQKITKKTHQYKNLEHAKKIKIHKEEYKKLLTKNPEKKSLKLKIEHSRTSASASPAKKGTSILSNLSKNKAKIKLDKPKKLLKPKDHEKSMKSKTSKTLTETLTYKKPIKLSSSLSSNIKETKKAKAKAKEIYKDLRKSGIKKEEAKKIIKHGAAAAKRVLRLNKSDRYNLLKLKEAKVPREIIKRLYLKEKIPLINIVEELKFSNVIDLEKNILGILNQLKEIGLHKEFIRMELRKGVLLRDLFSKINFLEKTGFDKENIKYELTNGIPLETLLRRAKYIKRKGFGSDTLKNLSSKGATISMIYDELSEKNSLKDLTDLINAYHKEQNLPKSLAREKLEKQKK